MNAFELVHTIRFEAARRLTRVPPGHPCGNLYGLAFYLDIHVEGDLTDDTGWVIDFGEIEAAFAPIRARSPLSKRDRRLGEPDVGGPRALDLGRARALPPGPHRVEPARERRVAGALSGRVASSRRITRATGFGASTIDRRTSWAPKRRESAIAA